MPSEQSLSKPSQSQVLDGFALCPQTAQKLSVSLDPAAMAFIDVYRLRHNAASRSQGVNVALHTLERLEHERTLEAAYRLSSQDDAQLNAEFEGVAMDGLAHEAW